MVLLALPLPKMRQKGRQSPHGSLNDGSSFAQFPARLMSGVRVALFEFGPFLLDPSTRSLLRDAVSQTLAPKTFDLLLLLVEQRARVVSKDELLQALWPGTFVEEGTSVSRSSCCARSCGRGTTNSSTSRPSPGVATVSLPTCGSALKSSRCSSGAAARPCAPRRLMGPLMFSVLIAGVALWRMRWGGSSAETSDPRIVSVTSFPVSSLPRAFRPTEICGVLVDGGRILKASPIYGSAPSIAIPVNV